MSDSRRRRGRETELIVARHVRKVWPYAEPTSTGAPGRDITGTGAVAWEVKARRGLDLPAWMRQATKNAADGHIPALAIRQTGDGPANVDDWPVVVRMADFLWMCNELRGDL